MLAWFCPRYDFHCIPGFKSKAYPQRVSLNDLLCRADVGIWRSFLQIWFQMILPLWVWLALLSFMRWSFWGKEPLLLHCWHLLILAHQWLQGEAWTDPPSIPVAQISSMLGSYCGVALTDGKVHCWGRRGTRELSSIRFHCMSRMLQVFFRADKGRWAQSLQ